MKNMLSKLVGGLVLSVTIGTSAQADTFVFTAIPDEDETRLVERFTGVADYLSGELGVDVRYVPVKSYAAAVSAFRNDQVQLAWFGGLFGVQARPLDEVFSRVGYSGNHQAGALNFQVWEKELEAGDTDQAQVIWKTPAYPDYQWTIRAGVDDRFGEGLKARVTEALMNLEDKKLLASFPRSSFIPASDDDYEPIRKVAKQVGILD